MSQGHDEFRVVRIERKPVGRKVLTFEEAAQAAHEYTEHNDNPLISYGIMPLSSVPICEARVHHGPGRQSTTYCEASNPQHEYHYAQGPRGEDWEWKRKRGWVDDSGHLYREDDGK